ncbi:DUF5050 domain-containing protein [Vallitalea guaymasensis]|uniref:DUF5050 domain-containing protein n=1 Tax=Vallitalea guaymasensis TaxID=1185412 RepID=UPI000DE46050|nr:DUF5050 domain-containing protein [Vallitalea guaymasensis]
MDSRYIRYTIMIGLIVLLVGCNKAQSQKKSYKISPIETINKNENTKIRDNENKQKQKQLNNTSITKKYANLSDDNMNYEDWYLYTEYGKENKPYIYRFNIKTGNKVRVCQGKMVEKTLMSDTMHYINETGIKLLHNNQNINLLGRNIDQYEKIENGYVYISADSIYHFNTTTNTESILTTFKDSIADGTISAASNNNYIMYSIKTDDRVQLNIYNIGNNENKTILQDQVCSNIMSIKDKFFLYNDSNKEIMVYDNDELKELVTAYPSQNKISYYNDKIYYVSDNLYIFDTNDYSIKTVNTYSSENTLLEIKDDKVYLYGNQLMIYYIEQDRIKNKNIYLETSNEIDIVEDMIYQINRKEGYIIKSDLEGRRVYNYSLECFIDYFVGDNCIYLLDDKGIISKIDKDTLASIETTRKYDNSYIYQVKSKRDNNVFRVENYNALVHLNENTYYPSSSHRLISLESNKRALEELNLSNSDWYDYNDKFIVYVDESGILHYYNRYTKEKKSLKASNINNLRIINNSIFYYSIDDRALYCYKNNRHKKIVEGNIKEYEVVGNKVYYVDKYLYRVNIDGTEKEKLNDYSTELLIGIDNELFYMDNEDRNALYRINNNEGTGELIDRILTGEIKDYFTDGEKLYLYYNDKYNHVIQSLNINSLEFERLYVKGSRRK